MGIYVKKKDGNTFEIKEATDRTECGGGAQ